MTEKLAWDLRDMLDRGFSEVEIIIQTKHGRFEQVRERVRQVIPVRWQRQFFRQRHTGLLFEQWPEFHMLGARLPARFVEDLAQDPNILFIWPDRVGESPNQKHQLPRPKLSKHGYPQVPDKAMFKNVFDFGPTTSFYVGLYCCGTQIAYNKGFYGSGVTIGLIDSGVDAACKSFKGADVEFATIPTQRATQDVGDHGTRTAGSLVGQTTWIQEMDNMEQPYRFYIRGAAPRSTLVSINVRTRGIHISDYLGGIQQALRSNVDVIVLEVQFQEVDEFEKDYTQQPYKLAKTMRVPIVIAAGNYGSEDGSISANSSSKDCFAVGAYDAVHGQIESYSGRGPTNRGLIKPDCVGPTNYYTARDFGHGCYGLYSGTSGATGMAGGVVALAREMWQTYLDKPLTIQTIFKVLEMYGWEKNNEHGWGPIYIQMFMDYLVEEKGVRM